MNRAPSAGYQVFFGLSRGPAVYRMAPASLAGGGVGGGGLGLGVLEDRIGQVREATVDPLEVRQQVEVDGAGFVGLGKSGVETSKMPITQLLLVLVDPFLVA